jgi:hypothetical protein
LQPSKRFLSGLNAADISPIQCRLFGVFRSSSDDSTVAASATENLKPKPNDTTPDQFLSQLAAYPEPGGRASSPQHPTRETVVRRKASTLGTEGDVLQTPAGSAAPETLKTRGAVLRCVYGQEGRRTPRSCGARESGAREAEVERRGPTGKKRFDRSRRYCRERFRAVNNTKGH